MKNRIGKTIVTLLAVKTLLIGIMPFENREIYADGEDVQEITSVTLIITPPNVGDPKNGMPDVKVPNGANYKIEWIEGSAWIDKDHLPYTGGIFVEGDYAETSVVLSPAEGFKFSENSTVTVEGSSSVDFISSTGTSAVVKAGFSVKGTETVTEYPLLIEGNRVTSAYLSNTDDGWSYDPDSKTLTLNNAGIVAGGALGAIYVTDSSLDLTIALAGESTVTGSIAGCSILSDGSLTIAGNGKLILSGGNTGIISMGALTVKDKADLTIYSAQGITADSAKISGSTVTVNNVGAYGILTAGSLEITGSEFTANGKNLGLNVASVKISGSTVTIKDSGNYGIWTTGSLEITDSEITAAGKSMGITAGSAKISGSTVTATGSSYSGFEASNGAMEITDSKIETRSSNYGIFQRGNGKLLIKGESTVKAVVLHELSGIGITGISAVDIELDGVEIVKPANGTFKNGNIYAPNDDNPSKDVLIEPIKGEYAFASGADGTYILDSGKDYTITVKRSVNDHRCFDHFKSVEMDGQALEKDADYTAEKGSTIITLKAAALNRLSEGDHKITVSFDDGKAETSLTVKAAPAPTPDPTPVTPYQIPKTGIE